METPHKLDIIRIRVTTEFKKQVEKLAVVKGFSISEYVRYLLQRELDNTTTKGE